MRSVLFVGCLLFSACTSSMAADPSVIVGTTEFLVDKYTVVTVHLGADTDVRLYGGHAGGLTFADAFASIKGKRRQTVARMNGGIYGPDDGPVGLFVADGQELHSINLGSGEGNFFLKPNGVFWIDTSNIAHVTVSTAFPSDHSRVAMATQSGPMLLVDGTINAEIHADSPNKLRRNAVGVSADGKTVQLVISDGNVRFYDMAALFHDKLGCNSALYLDGAVSNLWTNGNIPTASYGSVIAITIPGP